MVLSLFALAEEKKEGQWNVRRGRQFAPERAFFARAFINSRFEWQAKKKLRRGKKEVWMEVVGGDCMCHCPVLKKRNSCGRANEKADLVVNPGNYSGRPYSFVVCGVEVSDMRSTKSQLKPPL